MAGHALFFYYSARFVRSQYNFDTTRQTAWIAESLAKEPVPSVRLRPPKSASLNDVRRLHSENCLLALQTGQSLDNSNSSKTTWDSGLPPMALSTIGGVLAAGKAATRDGVASYLATGFLHGKRDKDDGFCTLYGLLTSENKMMMRVYNYRKQNPLCSHFLSQPFW